MVINKLHKKLTDISDGKMSLIQRVHLINAFFDDGNILDVKTKGKTLSVKTNKFVYKIEMAGNDVIYERNTLGR